MVRKYWPVIIVVALIALVIFVRFGVGGNEDDWICEDGLWVAHGHPTSPMPTGSCGPAVSTKLEFSSGAPAGPSQQPADCPKYVNCMPGPDVNRTCFVPPGCEGVTEKVY